jgi:hypothetical protein
VPKAVAIAAIHFLIFFTAGTILGWPSLNYRWFADDLHLIREFSRDELALVWHHTWDLDGYETVGYRPLSVLFNHARASLFGEAMAWHRLFCIALMAAYLVLIARIGRRFGLTTAATTLAGVMMICAKYSCYHFLLIIDGVHGAQGIAGALAMLAILRWVDSGAFAWLCASVGIFAVGVLLREDSIAIAPVLVALATLASRRAAKLAEQRSRLIGYACVLAMISLAALLARQSLLTPETDSPWSGPRSVAFHLVEVITLAGWRPLILVPIFAAIFALLLLGALRLKREDAATALAWLVCAGLTATPGIVQTRVNLLFFPITFYCLFAAQVVTSYASGRERHFGTWGRAIAVGVALICIVVPARASRLQQLSLAPGSAVHVETDCDIARGGEWGLVTPPNRRDDALRELARLGLDSKSCETVIDASGRVRAERLPPGAFVPPLPFLSR